MSNRFMAGSIECEVLPRINKRTGPIPEGHYPIVADMKIDSKDYEFCDIFKDDIPKNKSKRIFAKSVLLASNRRKKLLSKE